MQKNSKVISVRSRTRGYPLSRYLFKIVVEVLARATRQLREVKGIQISKAEVKILLFAGEMVMHVSDLKHSTRELLHLINSFSKVADIGLIKKLQ